MMAGASDSESMVQYIARQSIKLVKIDCNDNQEKDLLTINRFSICDSSVVSREDELESLNETEKANISDSLQTIYKIRNH